MSKWILIEVENQSINEPDAYDSYERAFDEMEKRYNYLLEDGDESNIHKDYASIQTDSLNIDWRIYKVTM